MGNFGKVRTSLGKFGQVWASLGKFGQVRTRPKIRKMAKSIRKWKWLVRRRRRRRGRRRGRRGCKVPSLQRFLVEKGEKEIIS